jgi:hypothetical protein
MESLSTLNFPVIKGIQAEHEYYVAMWTLRTLKQISIFDEQELPPELRAQRVINKARIPEIANYILNNRRDYIFSAITASIDSEVEFVPISPKPGENRIGMLKVPMDAKFIINDGQHRYAAILSALEQKPELGGEKAIGMAGNAPLQGNPTDWKTRLMALAQIDWSRKNAKLWEGRALIGGKVSKVTTNVMLTTNVKTGEAIPRPRSESN